MIRFTINLFIFVITLSESNGAPKSVPKKWLKQEGDFSGFVVGGVEATPHEFPWLVGFRKTAHHCGGMILNQQWIISAAHCFSKDPSEYSVVAGDHRSNEEDGTEQRRSLDLIIKHPLYNALNQNDIALIRVSPPFEFNEFVQPVDLVRPDFTPSGEPMLVAGWGDLLENGELSDVLMKVQIPYVPEDKCKKMYGERITETMICGGEEGKDACNGDSGGPLLCMEGGKRALCGIVSFGTGCARPEKVGVYTKIWPYYDWMMFAFGENKQYQSQV